MALPSSGFSLADIKAEIVTNGGTVSEPFTLSRAIEIAGKTGEWNKLSDFAGWSYIYLEVDPTYLHFGAAGSNAQHVNVNTNSDYSVSASDSWILIENKAQNGFDVRALKNDNLGSEARDGRITVQAGDITKTITVCQDGIASSCN